MSFDVLIIGAGILGSAVAWQLRQRYPQRTVCVLDKEDRPARHQSGHNSGVIHAGVYYSPGSLKARFCRQGLSDTLAFARDNNIPFNQCGKLLVATDDIELQRMKALLQRCKDNGIDATVLDRDGLQTLEPNVTGSGAIHVKDTGIIDYAAMTRCLLDHFTQSGGTVLYNGETVSIQENDSHVTVSAGDGVLQCRYLVVCAGLQADRLAVMHGLSPVFRIIPFRGEYYRLHERHGNLVSRLIYPVPDPAMPFLGVHITRMIDGTITVGPGAVPGWKREGYGRLNLDLRDSLDSLTWPGFWLLAARHWRFAASEYRSALSKRFYLEKVKRYCPAIRADDLQPWPAGVRAQAVFRDGTLAHDFLFQDTPRSLHVCNAPSPAATSAIPIARYICDKVQDSAVDLGSSQA